MAHRRAVQRNVQKYGPVWNDLNQSNPINSTVRCCEFSWFEPAESAVRVGRRLAGDVFGNPFLRNVLDHIQHRQG